MARQAWPPPAAQSCSLSMTPSSTPRPRGAAGSLPAAKHPQFRTRLLSASSSRNERPPRPSRCPETSLPFPSFLSHSTSLERTHLPNWCYSFVAGTPATASPSFEAFFFHSFRFPFSFRTNHQPRPSILFSETPCYALN